MEYFAGLDVSMAETQICIVARNGAVIHKAKVPSTPADIAAELAQVPACRRIVFETSDALPWPEPARTSSRLRREPAGLSGIEAIGDAQDRPQ
jgi:hypothetical protein